MATGLQQRTLVMPTSGVKAATSDVRVSPRSLRRFALLANQADKGTTVNISKKSDDEILALLRR